MKVTELQKLLDPTGAKIVATHLLKGQDYFVLYPKRYRLEEFSFKTHEQLKQYFGGRKIMAMDVEDTEDFIKVVAYVSSTKKEQEQLARRQKLKNGVTL